MIAAAMASTQIWLAYLALLILSIPWYWPAVSGDWLVFGVPLWALVSLLCYVAAAILTVFTIDKLWYAQVGDDVDGEV